LFTDLILTVLLICKLLELTQCDGTLSLFVIVTYSF